ncbi:hypothetical protein G1H11_16045 [Phytoactinopolyspora alkaliphila]|uniref:Uncharacterized protein n=1 Tax=Phytoactinopolyspora alkaliphila TaxID=1783498 RepID=A0A6N9YPG0_9ACTN|nr:hypothetical protein [Phytoactinopolyspora alkaliphila]NED96820.1 hypothetical protein [Phytoactinopolyspora alkaliphila]
MNDILLPLFFEVEKTLERVSRPLTGWEHGPDPDVAKALIGHIDDAAAGLALIRERLLAGSDAAARVRLLHRRADQWLFAHCCDCEDKTVHRTAMDRWENPVCVEPQSHQGVACTHCRDFDEPEDWPCATIRALNGDNGEPAASAIAGGDQR